MDTTCKKHLYNTIHRQSIKSTTTSHFVCLLNFLKEIFFIVFYMMLESPGSKDIDEICPVCNKSKDKHMSNKMFACSCKIEKFQKQESDRSQ